MSQLFDFFACNRPQIEDWAAALARGDEAHHAIEASMPGLLQLTNIGDN